MYTVRECHLYSYEKNEENNQRNQACLGLYTGKITVNLDIL